jgi:predicted CXXCH cytochrome family protein
MKKALVALALAAVASTASATIANGKHDLSVGAGTLSACQYCHAPHNANITVQGAPLWNRDMPDANTYTVYTSNTLKSAVALGANSLTCLSCHDGQVAMGDTYVGTNDATNVGKLSNTSYALIGQDLRNDHPVGVTYTEGNGFALKTAVATAGLKLYTAGTGVSVECGSCHDPHGVSDAGSGGSSFLRSTAGTICTDCHLK